MSTLNVKLAQTPGQTGNGFCIPIGVVRSVRAAKKRGLATVCTDGWKGRGPTDWIVVGEWRPIRAKWRALLAAARRGR